MLMQPVVFALLLAARKVEIIKSKDKSYLIFNKNGKIYSIKDKIIGDGLERLRSQKNYHQVIDYLLGKYKKKDAINSTKVLFNLINPNTYMRNSTKQLLKAKNTYLSKELKKPQYQKLIDELKNNIKLPTDISLCLMTTTCLDIKECSSQKILPIRIGTFEMKVGPILKNNECLSYFLNLSSFFIPADINKDDCSPLIFLKNEQITSMIRNINQIISTDFCADSSSTKSSKNAITLLSTHEITKVNVPSLFTEIPHIELINESFHLNEILLDPEPTIESSDGGYRSISPFKTIENLKDLFEIDYKILAKPIFIETENKDVFIHCSDTSKSTSSSGKGSSYLQSMAGAMAENIERFIHSKMQKQYLLEAKFKDITHIAYLKELINKKKSSFDSNKEGFWLPAYSLINKKTMWVPYEYSIKKENYNLKYHQLQFNSTTNGMAAGNTAHECILQGLLELIERDHVAIWWYNKIRVPHIDLLSFEDRFLHNTKNHYANLGKNILCLDLTLDLNTYVVVAVRTDNDHNVEAIGFGAHLDIKIALNRAITELSQNECYEGKSKLLNKLNALKENDKEFILSPTKILKSNTYRKNKYSTINSAVNFLLNSFEKKGFDVLAQDYLSNKIKNFYTFRIIAPLLCHLFPLNPTKRLLKTPCSAGILETPRNINELNEIELIL